MTQSRAWKPDDVIRAPAYWGGFRVWRVVGVYLGGTAQESVIEIETLDRLANTQGRMCVPCELLDAVSDNYAMSHREPPDDTPIPACLYSCSRDSCAEERTWPASDLHWVPAWEGWYCDLCLDDLHEDEDVEVGISLAAWLKSRRPVSVPG